MTAAEVLAALRRHYSGAAILSEIVIHDYDWTEHYQDGGKVFRRIDGLMFESLMRTAIEIKVSTADARRESFQKIAPWRNVCHRFVYAVPAGLVVVPPITGTGLWWVHPDGRVEVIRKAVVNRCPEPLPQHVVQAIAYRSVGRSLIGAEVAA